MKLPIYHISKSEANGPGIRLVIWVQGCRLHCKNCFNPETHSFSAKRLMDIEEILYLIQNDRSINGVSFSGGEPLEYPEAILEIIKGLPPRLNSILFSGYTLDEILKSSAKLAVVKKADLSILGRYDDSLSHPYLGKKFVKTSNSVDLEYFRKPFRIEYRIEDKEITKTGIFKQYKHGV